MNDTLQFALVRLYPKCFAWNRPRPIKAGIFHDLVAAGHPPDEINQALGVYCDCARYLKALKAGAPRIDLDGRPVGTVSDDEARFARQRLAQVWSVVPAPPKRYRFPREPGLPPVRRGASSDPARTAHA